MTIHLVILRKFQVSDKCRPYELRLVWLIFSAVAVEPVASIFKVPQDGSSMSQKR
jgi:hypothetical protein